MRVLQFLLVLFIVNATVLACGGQRSSSGSRWVLKSQDNIPLVAPQTFHVCIPVGVTPQNDSLLNTFQPFMATIQFVFEEKVSFMELDWDYNGKGIDYAEKSQTNVVTLLLHDYNGASHFNWSPVSLVRGTVSALVRADKKLLKVIFAIATIKSSLNSVSGCTYFSSLFFLFNTTINSFSNPFKILWYVSHSEICRKHIFVAKEVCDHILASKDKNKASEHSRLFANWMVFLVACLGTFCILLCGLKVCLLIYRRHSRSMSLHYLCCFILMYRKILFSSLSFFEIVLRASTK